MRVIVRYFGVSTWDRLAMVLEASLRRHCAHWVIDLQRFDPPMIGASPLGLNQNVCNTQKLDEWVRTVEALPDGEDVLLLDADTVVLRPLDDVWRMPFDLAYTGKPVGARYPLNAGVIFLRVSARTKRFLTAWMVENRRFFQDPREHQVWRPNYGGMNQSAFGALLHADIRHSLCVARLPCAEWNVEDEHWDTFDPAVARILHVKSELRETILRGTPAGEYRALARLWLDLEAQTTVARTA